MGYQGIRIQKERISIIIATNRVINPRERIINVPRIKKRRNVTHGRLTWGHQPNLSIRRNFTHISKRTRGNLTKNNTALNPQHTQKKILDKLPLSVNSQMLDFNIRESQTDTQLLTLHENKVKTEYSDNLR